MSLDANIGERNFSEHGLLDGSMLSVRLFGEPGSLSDPLTFSPLNSQLGTEDPASVLANGSPLPADTPEARQQVSDLYLRSLIQYMRSDDPDALIPPDWLDLIDPTGKRPNGRFPRSTPALGALDDQFERLNWPQGRPMQSPATGAEQPGPLTNQVTNINLGLASGQAPTWSAESLNRKLAGTPMAGLGQFIYAEALRYGIDDRIPMIIANNESAFGRSDLGQRNHNPFGMRARSGWQQFPHYQGAIDKWFQLMKKYQSDFGSRTYAQVMEHYAPSSDGNNFRQLVSNGSVLVAQVNQIEAANRGIGTTAMA